MTVLLILAVLLVPQIWALAVRVSAARRIGLLSGSVLAVLLANANAQRQSYSDAADLVYHDTYYVVPHFTQLFGFLIILPFLALLLWVAARWAGPLPRIAPFLASLLSVSITAPVLFPFFVRPMLRMPRRHIEYEGFFAKMALLNTYSSLLFFLLCLVLILMALFCLLRRLNTWSKSR